MRRLLVLPLLLAALAVPSIGASQSAPQGPASDDGPDPSGLTDALRADGDTAARAPDLRSDAEILRATREAIVEILDDPDLPEAFWGLFVQDARTGRVLVSRNARKNFVPASTLKLFTSATALDALGPDFRYSTRLYFFGDEGSDGVLRGDLVIRGAGDPTFGSDLSRVDPLETWAEALAEAGVRRVEGRIIGDDGRGEDEPYPEGWDVSHIATESYAPASGGLPWADNLVNVKLAGTSNGSQATVTVDPPGFGTITSDVVSGRSGLSIRRALGTDEIELEGGVSTRYRGTVRLPVANPTLYAAAALADRLREAGIVVQAQTFDADDLDRPVDYGAAEPLQVAVSPTLDRIVERVLQESDNLYAEQLLRTVSPDGSIDGGVRRVLAFADEAGADTDGLNIVDGSGLSRKNLVTPMAMAAVLQRMRTHPASGDFLRALPTGGTPGSTLRSRLRGVPVRAKTGSLLAVRCLAGYVEGPRGEPLIFVILANHYTTNGGRIGQAADRIVRALHEGERLPITERDD